MSLVGEGPMNAPRGTWSRRSMLATSLAVSVLLAPGLMASTAPPADGADPPEEAADDSGTTDADVIASDSGPGASAPGEAAGDVVAAAPAAPATPDAPDAPDVADVDPATTVSEPGVAPAAPAAPVDASEIAGPAPEAATIGADTVAASGQGADAPTPGSPVPNGDVGATPESQQPETSPTPDQQALGPAAEDGPEVVLDGALVVDKLVDADGDGTFSDVETARSATAAVAFQVTLANTTTVPLEILSVVDELGTGTLDLLVEPACAALATTLEPGASTSCTFTLDRYVRTWATPPRSVLTNEVVATATDGEAIWTGSDDATVHNANALVVSAEVTITTDADGDGTFTDDEQAPSPGADVPVGVEVVNTSPGAVIISQLVGTWGDGDPRDLLASECPALDGMKLWGVGGGDHDGGDHEDGDHGGGDHDDAAHVSPGAAGGTEVADPHATDGHESDVHDSGSHDSGSHEPGAEPGEEPGHEPGHEPGMDRPSSVVCTFTLVGHAPDFDAEIRDVVEVTLAKKHSPQHAATATDSARVWVGPAPLPEIDVELHVGPVDGPLGDHDEAPGVTIEVPTDGALVAFEVVVTNIGETPLTEVELASADLDLAACGIPDLVASGDAFTCAVGPRAAEVGAQVFEVQVVAMGGDQQVHDADPAHYLGVAVTPPPDDTDGDAGGGGDVDESPRPVTWTPRSTHVATTDTTTLAATGAPVARLLALSLVLLLLGIASMLVPRLVPGRVRSSRAARRAGP